MLLVGDLGRYEDAEMADAVVKRVHDDVAVGLELAIGRIKIDDPVQRLLRRRDVVAVGREHDDRRLDPGEIDRRTVFEERLAAGEPVADEQVLHDPPDLAGVHEVEAGPPALEIEKPRRFAVHPGEQVKVLTEPGLAGIQLLEVEHQVGAVEPSVAEIGGQQSRHRAPGEAAEVAQRIAALRSGPVGQRRACDHHRSGQIGMRGGENHGGPAALAVAGHQRLGAVRVARLHLLQEDRFRRAHVGEGLGRLGRGEKDHEIDGVSEFQRDADFGFALEAADPAAVSGARIDDHPGP